MERGGESACRSTSGRTRSSCQRWPADLNGFDVEATDGSIGHVDEARYDVGSSYLVVDTGPWIFGKKVLLPAGALTRVDLEDKKVYVRLTKGVEK